MLHLTLGPPDTFWTFDNGGKALVVAHLKTNPGQTWLSYPGRHLDPELRAFPIPFDGDEPYAELHGTRVFSSYLAPFLWIVLPFAAAFGFAGLGVLPALGGGAAVALTGWLAARLVGPDAGPGPPLGAAAIVALASPLLFYSSVFWEHTPVIALAAAAALLLVERGRERPLAAGLLLGAAALFREEAMLLLVATGFALVITWRSLRTIARFSASGAAGVLALALANRAISGSWLGVHASVNRPELLAGVGEATESLLLGAGWSGVPVAGGAAIVALLAASRLWPGSALGARAASVVGVAALTAVAAAAAVRFPGPEDRALALISSNSALVFLPWALAVPFLPGGAVTDRSVFLALVAAGFVVLFLAFVPPRSVSGVHPGPRMLLPALPIVAAFAVTRWRHRQGWFLLPLLLIGVAWNARSLDLLHGKRQLAGEIATMLAEDPRRIVATNLFWLPTELSPLWSEKQFHLVSGSEDLADLAVRAAAYGERELAVVTVAGAVPRRPAATARSERFPAFSVDLHVQPLGRTERRLELPRGPRRHAGRRAPRGEPAP